GRLGFIVTDYPEDLLGDRVACVLLNDSYIQEEDYLIDEQGNKISLLADVEVYMQSLKARRGE
ncbi:MAG: hypothetical protein U1A25_02560, partial [Candidatus Sungbacteria bacterium]|nr:hypothetical protein [Candidatus Sungbacteria bacterium]